ncbi:hypothetical protein C2E23DRAFT_683769, partial [Lenzites betulinus]
PIVDAEGTVFAVLAGRPRDEGWDKEVCDATRALEDARATCGMNGEYLHRRGEYPCITSGISYGGGQTHPSNFDNGPTVQRVLNGLLARPSIRRLANYANGAFRLWAPRLHTYYATSLRQLREHDPALRPNFSNNAFAACTFNLGPRTVTYIHIDGLNLPWGWCTVTPLGSFDHTRGGHLILWDLRMLIEVPAGSTVLIPSAILRHSNTQIGKGESRLSITQYSAGGLFRWLECG